MIQLKSRTLSMGLSASLSCFVDGAFDEHGKVRPDFDKARCAEGILSSLLIDGLIGVSGHSLTKLRNLPAGTFRRGLRGLFGSTDYHVTLYANGIALRPGIKWKIWKAIRGQDLTPEDLHALFGVDLAAAGRLRAAMDADPNLKKDLLENDFFDYFHELSQKRLADPSLAGALLDDLTANPELRDNLAVYPELVGSWEVVYSGAFSSEIRNKIKVVTYYREISSYIKVKQIEIETLLNSIANTTDARRKISLLGLDLDAINNITGTFGRLLYEEGSFGLTEVQLVNEFIPGPNTGFTGVMNFRQGEFSMAPSYITDISNSSYTELLPRTGGHALLANNVFEETEKVAGFALHYVEEGKIEVSWLSGMNRNRGYGYPPPDDRMLRDEFRGYIINALGEIFTNTQIVSRP